MASSSPVTVKTSRTSTLCCGGRRRACASGADLLMLNGRDLRPLALEKRKAKLSALLAKTPGDTLRLSHTFRDGEKLLHEAAQNGLEGIVSKQRESVYVAGPASGWIKVKTAEWRVSYFSLAST